MASRIVLRPTPNAFASSVSVGIWVPGFNSPFIMALVRRETTVSTTDVALMGARYRPFISSIPFLTSVSIFSTQAPGPF